MSKNTARELEVLRIADADAVIEERDALYLRAPPAQPHSHRVGTWWFVDAHRRRRASVEKIMGRKVVMVMVDD